MTIVNDSIATQLSALVPTGTAPAVGGALGYGTDLSCVTDLAVGLDEVDPNSVRAISEAAVRRLITPRGALQDDLDYGYDVRGYANRGVTELDLRNLAGHVRAEVLKDDRAVDATAAVVASGSSLTVTVTITPEDPVLGSFELVFSVADNTALLQSIV
jgi:hypothetical protein